MQTLKDFRQARGWTLKEGASRLAMSVARLARLEAGKEEMTPSDFKAVSEAFEISIEDLNSQLQSTTMNEAVAVPEGEVLQIRRIGNSLGLILPKDLLAKLDLSEGDLLHVVRQPDRGVQLTPYDPKHAKAMDLARKAFKTYANTFKALAK